jgi:hypothetical protein
MNIEEFMICGSPKKQQLQAVSMGFPIMNFGNTIDKDWSGLQGGL